MEWMHENIEHVLVALLLVSRLGDVVSTFLVSPGLKLESNPVAKRLGWRFILPSLVICILPYFSLPLAVGILAPSLFVSASNLSKVWAARAMGEEGYLDHLVSLARRTTPRQAYMPLVAASLFTMLAGWTLMFLGAEPPNELAQWFGFGIILYGGIQLLYGALSVRRMFRLAGEREDLEEQGGSRPGG
jgi:hypothetical protein